jgi:poly(3-hydroxybutyrate) depolymerase
VALLTVEGEHDDISGVGQTEAAHNLCVNIPASRKAHWLQPTVGHYGVFNGSRFRAEIAPRISDFILSTETSAGTRRKEAQSAASDPRAVAIPPESDARGDKANGSHRNGRVPHKGEAKAPPRPTHGPGRA